jgi:hypothetical protein
MMPTTIAVASGEVVATFALAEVEAEGVPVFEATLTAQPGRTTAPRRRA